MSREDTNVISLSGQPVYLHGAPGDWQSPGGEENIRAVSDHIERHLGSIETVFHEIVSDTVHIDVHWVRPNVHNPCHRLVTSGMSDLPMRTPDDTELPRFMELMISLPPHWQIDQESFKDEAWYWPVRLIKFLARLPHKYETWLGFGHTVPNGDPAEPYAPDSGFNGCIILPSVTAPDAFAHLAVHPGKTINFMSIVPLYAREMDLKLRRGVDALLEQFDRKGVTDIFAPDRSDVARKRFGFL